MPKTMPKLGLKHTTYDGANGIYVYQRHVPETAQWLVQKKKVNASLGATPAEARARYTLVHAKWEKAFSDAIAAWTRDDDTIDTMDRIVLFLNSQASQHGGDLPDSGLARDRYDWKGRAKLWDLWSKWNEVHDGTQVGDILADGNHQACDDLIIAYEVFRAAIRRRISISAQLPAPLPEAGIATQDGQMVMSLIDLEKRWLGEKPRSGAVTGDMARMIKLFVAVNGNLAIHEITARHRLAFRDAVSKIPAKAQTHNKLLRTLSALGSYAEDLGVVTNNPLKPHAFEVTDEVQVEPFTDDQFNAIFASEGWANRSPKYGSFIRWAFILGAYTGARIGEIAQLRKEDVYEHQGHWVIRFTFDVEKGQQSKTKRTRLVPVCSALIKLGFLKFVKSIKSGQLWPEIKPNSNGNWSGPVSMVTNKPIRDMGLGTEYRFHSLRHTIKTRLRGLGVQDSVNDFITHPEGKKESVAATYGIVEIKAMKAALDLLDYRVKWPT